MPETSKSERVGESDGNASFTPVTVLSLEESALAVVKTGTHPSLLPFDTTACSQRTVTSREEMNAVSVQWDKKWKLQAKVMVSLDIQSAVHWVLLTAMNGNCDFSLSIEDTTAEGVRRCTTAVERALHEAALDGTRPHADIRIFIMSEPNADQIGLLLTPLCGKEKEEPKPGNERVFLADSAQQLSHLVRDVLLSFFVDNKQEPTSVCWPPQLPFPVNVHPDSDCLRIAEHEELLLPRQSLLRRECCLKDWNVVADIARPTAAAPTVPEEATSRRLPFRTGAPWERHCVTNPHTALRTGPNPVISGAKTLLTTGDYDYYHYRVDGFKDDGWGCAYRSLQTILSWCQHAGLMKASMPSLRDIQQILSTEDPDKMGKGDFVGSREWIGSFEIMIVLQYFVPGLECTIKRLESAAELDSDPTIQGMLFAHFTNAAASPVMIGGSSYAHTILGVHMNPETTEAQYLILDPHYSANPTNLKTAVNKGYIGWKEASKFFEASQWYNVCIPRVDLYDPR